MSMIVISMPIPPEKYAQWRGAMEDVEFREFLMNIYGLDLAEPPPGPMPEMVLDWRAPVAAQDV